VLVADRDERLVEIIAVADLTGGPQQTAVRRPLESLLDRVGAHYGRSVRYGGMKCIKKNEGPRPVVAGETLQCHRAPLPFAGRGRLFAYIAAVRPVFFPKPMSPTPIRRRDEIRPRRS